MKQRTININKVIREIEEYKRNIRNSECDQESIDYMQEFIRKDIVIQIIKDNIKETEEDKYNDLLQKYSKLSDKYFELKGQTERLSIINMAIVEDEIKHKRIDKIRKD